VVAPAGARAWSGTARWAAVGLAATVVAAAATVPTVDNGTAASPWTVDAIHQVDDDVVAAVDGESGVLVEMGGHLVVSASGPALFGVLQDAGVPFYVDDVALVRQLCEPDGPFVAAGAGEIEGLVTVVERRLRRVCGTRDGSPIGRRPRNPGRDEPRPRSPTAASECLSRCVYWIC
jgi:hypothetical protein